MQGLSESQARRHAFSLQGSSEAATLTVSIRDPELSLEGNRGSATWIAQALEFTAESRTRVSHLGDGFAQDISGETLFLFVPEKSQGTDHRSPGGLF